jgi:REP element-mobilizing transposase RayT
LTRCGAMLVDAFIHQRNQHGCRLFAFVVMQDHVHWLFSLPEDQTLSSRVKVLFNWVSVQINRVCGHSGRLWQDGYYDHLVRDGETLTGLIRYIEANPVRKGLCDEPGTWEWSSAYPCWQPHLDRDWLSFHRFE